MHDITVTIDLYLSAWNETDTTRRAELIDRVWMTDGRLIDPPLAAEGHAEISQLVSALQAQFPGHRFRRASAVDTHHDQLRVAWELVSPHGEVALSGLDVGEVTGDGRLRRMTGFFGVLPPESAQVAGGVR